MATSGSDNTVKLWDQKGALLNTLQSQQNSSILWLDFSPDEKTLATGNADSTVKLWSLDLAESQLVARSCGWLSDYLKNIFAAIGTEQFLPSSTHVQRIQEMLGQVDEITNSIREQLPATFSSDVSETILKGMQLMAQQHLESINASL